VHAAAEELGLPVRTPARLRRDAAEHAEFAALALDVAVVAAYGLILPQIMLDAPKRGCVNIHASLLPRWRGAAPIQAAILAGDDRTGITIMRMEEGLDTGPMLLSESVPITGTTTASALHDTLAALGARLILDALRDWPAPVQQPGLGVTYAAKLTRQDGRLDFTQTADALDRRVRAMTPWPGGVAEFAGGALKVLAATPVSGEGIPGAILDARFTVACAEGALRLDRVQRAGRPAMAGDAFLRGVPDWARHTVQ
jgi:methionyl-tRNA formyltransferase